MRFTVPTLAAAAVLVAAPPAAQAEASPFSAKVALTGQQEFHGQDPSAAARAALPALQRGLDFAAGSGHTVGAVRTGGRGDINGSRAAPTLSMAL